MPNPTGTGMVSNDSVLKRSKIIKAGMVTETAKSWWNPYKGNSMDAIVYSVNERSPKGGNTVVFDMRGALESKAIPNTTTAEGRGVQKKLFSDQVTISEWRYVVDNGTRFKNKAIDNLALGEHQDSIRLLADQWVRAVDQSLFDVSQQAAEFGFTFDMSTDDKTFDLNALRRVENAVKSGFGYDIHPARFPTRTPLRPFRSAGNEGMYLLLVDTFIKNIFLSDKKVADILKNADVRGNNNRLLTGVLGKIGNFVIVEAPLFMGTTDRGIILDNQGYFMASETEVLFPGLRRYVVNNQQKHWLGTPGHAANNNGNNALYGRAVILGAGAIQYATGLDPEYHLSTYDFGKFSESCLEVWTGVKAAQYYAENTDYNSVRFSGYNYGMAFIDVKIN